jgi:hypothetical protein
MNQPRGNGSDPVRILIGLLKLLMTPTIDSNTLIMYVEHNRIDPNTYLPSLQANMQMPLIYYCCSNASLTDFFLYLISKNVDLNAPMMCDDPNQQIELLYYSQIQYIPLLIEHGCLLNPQKIPESVGKLLVKGNINKLIILYKNGAVKKEELLPVLQSKGLIFRVLDQLYEKIYTISQQINNEQHFNNVYSEVIKSYINTFKFFFKNGVNINQIENGESFVQKVFNTYFFPLIQFVVTCQPNLDAEELLHYSNFDLLNRQVMKFIYTQQNYKQIEEYLRDKMTPKKINVKKNITRKIIQIKK